MASRFIAVKNVTGKEHRLFFEAEPYPFKKDEIKIVPEDLGQHALRKRIGVSREAVNHHGVKVMVTEQHPAFKLIPMAQALKEGAVYEENSQIVEARKAIDAEAALKAKIREEVKAELLAEAEAELKKEESARSKKHRE